MGPREDDLRSLRGLSDFEDIALDLIVRLEFFAFDLFCERQDPFYAAEVYKMVRDSFHFTTPVITSPSRPENSS